jgi:predicted dehydrogenase
MAEPRLPTVVVGLGKVGAGYAEDPRTARYYPYSTHAQVLADHPAFTWEATVDVSEEALRKVQSRWPVRQAVRSVHELPSSCQPGVVVLSTPPHARLEIVEQFPALRAVLVEKPLGRTPAEGQQFLDHCKRRGIQVQVNLWRRADETFRSLAAGRLVELVGRAQAVFGMYCNGLLNNGTHLIDFVRMLFGEIRSVRAHPVTVRQEGPIPGDVNVSFSLQLASGLVVSVQPLRSGQYRENGLDIWGEHGRLSIVQEGLGLLLHPRREHRALQGEHEVASDEPQRLPSTVGDAFYHLYSNLAAAVHEGVPLWSPGESALRTACAVDAVLASAQGSGKTIDLVDQAPASSLRQHE